MNTKHKADNANPLVYKTAIAHPTTLVTSDLIEIGRIYVIPTLVTGNNFAN